MWVWVGYEFGFRFGFRFGLWVETPKSRAGHDILKDSGPRHRLSGAGWGLGFWLGGIGCQPGRLYEGIQPGRFRWVRRV